MQRSGGLVIVSQARPDRLDQQPLTRSDVSSVGL